MFIGRKEFSMSWWLISIWRKKFTTIPKNYGLHLSPAGGFDWLDLLLPGVPQPTCNLASSVMMALPTSWSSFFNSGCLGSRQWRLQHLRPSMKLLDSSQEAARSGLDQLAFSWPWSLGLLDSLWRPREWGFEGCHLGYWPWFAWKYLWSALHLAPIWWCLGSAARGSLEASP